MPERTSSINHGDDQTRFGVRLCFNEVRYQRPYVVPSKHRIEGTLSSLALTMISWGTRDSCELRPLSANAIFSWLTPHGSQLA
jgi:hypothetical protein